MMRTSGTPAAFMESSSNCSPMLPNVMSEANKMASGSDMNQRDTHVPEELPQNIQRQSLAYQFVDVTPRELHHENEQANEEGAEEQRQKLL